MLVLGRAPGVERPSNYQLPETVKRDFPQEVRYEVGLRLDGRRVFCRCGGPTWTLFRDNEEFVCECEFCGSEATFGMLCFTLFDVKKADCSDVIDIADAAVYEY